MTRFTIPLETPNSNKPKQKRRRAFKTLNDRAPSVPHQTTTASTSENQDQENQFKKQGSDQILNNKQHNLQWSHESQTPTLTFPATERRGDSGKTMREKSKSTLWREKFGFGFGEGRTNANGNC